MGRRRRFTEAGKRNSKKDQSALVSAVKSIFAALDDDDKAEIAKAVNMELRDKLKAKLVVKGD